MPTSVRIVAAGGGGTPVSIAAAIPVEYLNGAAAAWTIHDMTLGGAGFSAGEDSVIYEGNPQVLTGSTTVFKMWYTGSGTLGHGAVCYAESLDGYTWATYNAGAGVLPHEGNCRSFVLKVGATYYCFAISRWADGAADGTAYGGYTTTGRMGLYTSADGVAWTAVSTDVLPDAGAGDWDHLATLDNMSAIVDGATWRMLYDVHKTTLNGGSFCQGYATSTTGTGLTWTKHAGAVLAKGKGFGTSSSFLTKIGSTYYAWMNMALGTNATPTDLYRFRSADCVTWVQEDMCFPRRGKDAGIGTLLEAYGQVADPYLLEVGGVTYMWYTEMSSQGQADSPVPGNKPKLASVPMTLAQLVVHDQKILVAQSADHPTINVMLPLTTTNVNPDGSADPYYTGVVFSGTLPFLHAAGDYRNVFLGAGAGNFTLTANSEVGIGSGALTAVTSGGNNVAIGNSAGHALTDGNLNVAVGYNSLNSGNSTYNVAIGQSAFQSAGGNNSVAIGSNAGAVLNSGQPHTYGTSNVFIGADTKPLADWPTYQIVIGKGAVSNGDHTATIGDSAQVRTVLGGGVLNMPLATKAANAAGVAGDGCYDANYIYVCTATNTWKRSALTGGY